MFYIDGRKYMENFDPNVVNPHYLQNVMDLARNRDVFASDDIYDARGIKLVAKGARVTDNMQERLVRFKLSKPLESSLKVEGGVTPQLLLTEAQIVLDEVFPLSLLIKAGTSSRAVLAVLKEIRFDRVSTLLLSMDHGGMGTGFRHSVLAAMTGVTLGIRLNLDSAALINIAMAALLHDVGELYINPEFKIPGRLLTPEEWKNIAAHPRIGQLVLEATPGISRAVSIAIGEHHERPNGFGYPRQLLSAGISKLGKILLMTELLCGIFPKQDQPMERACLAVKVIPGEYPADIVSLIASSISAKDSGSVVDTSMQQEFVARARRIEPKMNAALEYLSTPLSGGTLAATLLNQARERLLMLQRAMYSTGLSGCGDLEIKDAINLGDIMLEMDTVSYEIEWRLRELSRQTALNLGALGEGQREYFKALIACLS